MIQRFQVEDAPLLVVRKVLAINDLTRSIVSKY